MFSNINTAFVIIPILALVIACLSAAGIWYWWISAKEEAEGAEPPSEEEEPFFELPRLANLLQREGVPEPTAASSESVVEVMRIYRDLADGSLIIDIGGRRYHHIGEIGDPEIARRLAGNIQALAAMVGTSPGGGALPAVPAGPPAAPQQPATLPGPLPTAIRSRSAPEEPPIPVRRGIFGQRKDKPPPEPEPKSMIEQIEELLQFRLAMTPALARRAIHIRENEAGVVFVEVDGSSYEGVTEVPDEAVRSFIQATIQEWEARQ
jgi:hypothetical protein